MQGLREILLPGVAGFMLFLFAATGPALAGKADVVAVKVRPEGAGFSFEVTIQSDDTGWDKYADRWDIVAPDGAVLGSRVLLHPHEAEQPFTRSLSGVAIPEDIKAVVIRAHDKVEGFGGAEMTVALPGR